jgi:hypothetical protein
MSTPLLDQMRLAFEMIAALPPRPRCFMAHHAVPYGRCFHQWNTRGELLVWVNAGEIADISRRPGNPSFVDLLASIPVVFV